MRLFRSNTRFKVLVDRLASWLEANDEAGNSFVSEKNDDSVAVGEEGDEEDDEEEEGGEDEADPHEDAAPDLNGIGETDEEMEEALLAPDDSMQVCTSRSSGKSNAITRPCQLMRPH